MDHEQAKGAADKAKGANKDTGKQAQKGKFDKPLGSSHNDKVDMRGRGSRGGQKISVIPDGLLNLCRSLRAAFFCARQRGSSINRFIRCIA